MTLAKAIMHVHRYGGLLSNFAKKTKLRCLEVNEAGQLNQFLGRMKRHELVAFPEVDMQYIPRPDNYYDLVVHSDTLEHVPNPIEALKEVYRILKPGGFTCYTIPVIVDRMSKKRPHDKPSYHGSPGNNEYLVQTEYGADMWTQVFEAGFRDVRLFSILYPDSVAIIAKK